MHRRDISKAIVGIAATGVPVTNYQYSPNHVGDDVRRHGNIDLTGGIDCSAILSSANKVGVALYFSPGTYRISSNLTFSVPLILDYGAMLKPDKGVTLTINAPIWAGPWQIFNLSNSGAALAGVLQPINYDGAILVEWFGGGQGATDDSAYFNQALLAAHNSGGLVVRLLAKNYNVKNSIYMAGSSSAVPGSLPCLWGSAGPGNSSPQMGTRITTTGAIATVVANAGDSSSTLKAGIKDIHFVGNGNDISIQLNGCDYYDVERCTFDGPKIGLQFYCSSTSVYTEFCRAVKCVFNYCATAAIRYTVHGGGFTSFHGCGLQDCWVSMNSASQKVVIIDGRGAVYNAPLTFQCWTGGNAVTLIENNSTALSSCHGVITIEGGSPDVPIVLAGGTGLPIFFAGKLNLNSLGCTSGNFTQFDVVQTNGTAMSFYGGRKTTTFPLSTGTTQEAGPNLLFGTSRLVTIEIVNTARTYYYRAVLLVLSLNSGFTGQVTTLASYLQNNAAKYGAPTFAFGNAGGLAITNAAYPSSGVIAVVESTQIGGLPLNPNYSSTQGYAYV